MEQESRTTNKEALKVIKENLSVAIHDWDDPTDEYQREQVEGFQKAKEALEKQIPKKPIEAKNIFPPEQFECPVCGSYVGRHKTVKKINDAVGEILTDCKVEFAYCCECGQKQDWSK